MADLVGMTEREIITHSLRTFQAQYGAVSALPNNNVNMTAIVIGGLVHQFVRDAQTSVDARLMPDTALGANLDRIGADRGVFRREPKKAVGAVKVSGPNGTEISGSIGRCDGLSYTILGPAIPPREDCEPIMVCELDACPSEGLDTCATGPAVIEGGVVWVWVEADESGALGNYPAGTPLEDISDNVTVEVGPGGITSGCDEECDDDFRRRVQFANPKRPSANSACDIRDLIATAPGVTRVWVRDCCGVYVFCFAMDACYPDSQPQADDVVNVQSFITDECDAPLVATKIKPICAQNMAIELSCISGPVCPISTIEAGLRSWLVQSAEIGETISRDDVALIIKALCPGFKFTMPPGDFVAKSNGVFTTATVTVS